MGGRARARAAGRPRGGSDTPSEDGPDPRSALRDGRSLVVIGDNLEVLRLHVDDASVDLVYLDPPFNSRRDYQLLPVPGRSPDPALAGGDGSSPATGSGLAFCDSWSWDDEAERQFQWLTSAGSSDVPASLAAFVAGLRASGSDHDLLAYLVMMAPRLVELRRVLKQTGSLYLHCDPAASHYLKVMLDSLFGHSSFRREIVWRSGWVSGFKARAKNWVRNHDVILYYVKDPRSAFTFHKDRAYRPHAEGYARRGGGGNPKGVALDDVWDETALYSPWIKSFSKEKLGFMTQKPRALLERILAVSSSEGDLVLDPFLGCGTTAEVAHLLGRRWLGIDVSPLSGQLARQRIRESAIPADIEVLRARGSGAASR
ncbi:MAG: site-specific DNA-methyltransferase [Deltaproteobacteria bacterium]|nr:site-specific DNA-methyltransferase [Deltaproteobacteria bacterium]